MKGLTAALVAAIWLAAPARAADDLASAARELGRRTAAAVASETVSVGWRNLSAVSAEAVAQARAAFEAALRTGGGSAIEAQLTVSQSAASGLLVEELRKGDDRQVWIATFRRTAGPPTAGSAAIEKRLLWEDEEQILDIAAVEGGLLVLTPSGLLRTGTKQRVRITPSKPWPRDLRGRLRVSGDSVQVQMPGMNCSGTWNTELVLNCGSAGDGWVLAPGRNYFVGKNVPPFYTAAAADSLWFLTLTDGTTGIFDAAFARVGSVPGWGSDIAAAETRCGGAPAILATRPGEGRDAVQAFAIVNRSAAPIGRAAEFDGPVTALWSGVAVVHNGKYQAYAISLVCAR